MSAIPADTLKDIRERFREVERRMAQPDVATDPAQLADLGREHAELRPVVEIIDRYDDALQEKEDLRKLAQTEKGELADLARLELDELEDQLPELEDALRKALIPKDPEDARNAIMEIRAGTGGDEAALFAGDLLRLYERFAEAKGWKIELIEVAEGTQGGFKEVTLGIKGPAVFGTLRYESGVHRVQRVPATESQGRVHTSAATVAVLPEAEDIDVQINPNELKIDVYRSSGPGGQSVNTTDSAVRITHLPTGLVVSIQDEKSQHKNRDKAMRVLRSRLYQQELDRRNAERSESRKSQVGSGDRSEKIRTYNYPQNRVTDHRLTGDNKNHPLAEVMDGALDNIVSALRAAEQAEKLLKVEG